MSYSGLLSSQSHIATDGQSVISLGVGPQLGLMTRYLSITVKVNVTLRLTVSQSVSLGVEPHLGLMSRYLATTVKVKVTLRLTVSQSVSLGVEPHLGLMTRYLLLLDRYGLVFVGRLLWQEDGSVFYICCWPLPAKSLSSPRPLGLATIFLNRF
jgi:hypothetical protein